MQIFLFSTLFAAVEGVILLSHCFSQQGEDVVMGLGVSGLKTHSVWLGDHHRGCGRWHTKYFMMSTMKNLGPQDPPTDLRGETTGFRCSLFGTSPVVPAPSHRPCCTPRCFHVVFSVFLSGAEARGHHRNDESFGQSFQGVACLHGDAQIWVNFMGFPHGWPSQYWKDIRHSKVWSSLWIGDPKF